MVFLGFLLCEQQFKHGGGCQNGSFTFLLSPHTKGRRRGSCVIPSASITSKNHDNTINPLFPSLYPWLPPCAVPLVAIWRLPSAANPNRMNHSSRNRDFYMLD